MKNERYFWYKYIYRNGAEHEVHIRISKPGRASYKIELAMTEKDGYHTYLAAVLHKTGRAGEFFIELPWLRDKEGNKRPEKLHFGEPLDLDFARRRLRVFDNRIRKALVDALYKVINEVPELAVIEPRPLWKTLFEAFKEVFPYVKPFIPFIK